ncbi:hypothetical protein CE91St14_14780 [Porphyromonas somerae]|nr:hypothetical protein CE91St14_14780 [Porphyromonas somerae]
MLLGGSISVAQVRYPVHGTVQVLPPYGLYLSDYYGGSQDRLVVTLLNRDLEQPLLQARLRVRVKNGKNFSLESRDEIVYPILELSPNVPLRLTSIDIAPYLQPDHIRLSGRLDNGRLPVGMTEFSVQVVEYHTGRPLSAWHTGRAWLDIKNPPILDYPRPNEVIPYREPFTQVQFQWMPRHQGVSGTEYEFVLKELPDNGVAPQSAFAYGIEIYRTRQRQTRLSYSVMQPLLEKNKRYGWQVRAVAVTGIDEIGMFANNGFTEIGWFEVRETVSAPTGLTGTAGYGKVDLKWNGSPNHQGYIIQYHPITAGEDQWIEARSYDLFSTLHGMKLGTKYEIRVGAYGSDQRPVYCSPIEVTIPSVNESRLAECGKGLNVAERIQEPITNLQVGDTITIGPDFKMVTTELHALGDGWYSGKGSTLLTWIFESRIAVHFDRLRVNVQREQIDGEVFTDYDDTESQIANSDRIDDGGSGTHRVEIEVPTTSVDFVIPDMPEGSTYDATTGSLTIYDTNGEVHNVPIPKNESGEPTFPMLIKDSSGQTYEVNEPDESTAEEETSDDSTGRTDDRKKKGPRPVQIKKVEQITDFNREGLDSEYRLRFSGEGSRYAFDNGEEAWYQSAVKLDTYYEPLDESGYIAPWKLIPVGEKDVVTVTCSDVSVDATTIRFVLENGDIVPSKYDKTKRKWQLELPSVESGERYEVYGLIDGKTAGKLRVVSYSKQRHQVTIVQTNNYVPDAKEIESELNAIYHPIGIEFTVQTDTLFNKSWDLNGDGLLSIEGKTLFGKSVDVKESKEMRALQRLYTSTTKREGICIFSLDGEQGVHTSGTLLGEMPRNSRFGYVFTSGSPDVKQLAHTIAHELGHGLFTLQHTFDDEYGGAKSQGTTDNLMDYGTGTDLVAFQWNIMSKPAIFTALDKADEIQIGLHEGEYLGFTPDGRVIKSYPKNFIRLFDVKGRYVYSLLCEDGIVYKWENNNYKNQDGESFNVPDSPTTGKVGIWRKTPYPDCYILYQLIEVKNYTSKDFAKIKRIINNVNGKSWKTDLVYNASPDCIKQAQEDEKEGFTFPEVDDNSNVKTTIGRYLDSTSKYLGSNVEFALNGKVYRKDDNGDIEELTTPLSDEQINSGEWSEDISNKARFTIDEKGVLQLQAFGLKSTITNKNGKKINHKLISENIRSKTNSLLKSNNVTDLGASYISTSEVFADGGKIEIDATFAKVISEGIGITTTLLKTGEIQPTVYLSSSDAAIKAPGLVTGSTEVVAQKVTDLTSLGMLVYDIATDEDTRRNLKQQFEGIKEQVGEDPKELFSILGEVILTMGTGNTLEEWNKSLNSKDNGERSHLVTRGVGNTILSLTTGSAIIGSMPDMAENLNDAVKKVKRISNTLDDFIIKSLPDKLEDISNIWKTKYPLPEMFEGRTIFEDIMGHYRYTKTDGWKHTADIADNFKGVDFYKGIERGSDIYAETAVSMKTTIITNVENWLASEPIKKNIRFLETGLNIGIESNKKRMFINNAEVHIYMPKANITSVLKKEWITKLNVVYPKIKFEIIALEDFIK